MDDIVFLTDDHPEANGRTPKSGEQQYCVFVTLQDGSRLTIKMGKPTYCGLRDHMLNEFIDDTVTP